MIGLTLVLSSITIYYAQIIIFDDARNTLFYLFQDIAFVPLQVFIVTMIVEGLLSVRAKRETMKKMNVVISAFFSEVGIGAISSLSAFASDIDSISNLLNVDANWKTENFKTAARGIKKLQYQMTSEAGNLQSLKSFLASKRQFILTMFENSNLLEHDTFTEMLWAIFHVSDELESRDSLDGLPDSDLEHLSTDFRRAYQLLIYEWIYYMEYLKREYPYLFSLAVRKSPFNNNNSVVIK